MVHFLDQKVVQKITAKHKTANRRGAITLLAIQGALLVVLLGFMLMLILTLKESRHRLYFLLIGFLLSILFFAVFLNTRGKYKISTLITVISIIVAPWISILTDPFVRAGDLVPILYVGLSVQGCAILLREKWVIWISISEMLAVLTILQSMAKTSGINWVSLFAFIVATSAIAVAFGHTNRKQLEQIHDLSIRDSLTGLYNRRYMEETFDREIERMIRKDRKLAVAMTDVDCFKSINDSYGHVVGDLVLAHIGQILKSNTRSSDIACRYGGDEFILILPECSKREAIARAETIRTLIAKTELEFDGRKIQDITLSFGISELPEDGTNRFDLICAADKALYLSKQSGRNRIS